MPASCIEQLVARSLVRSRLVAAQCRTFLLTICMLDEIEQVQPRARQMCAFSLCSHALVPFESSLSYGTLKVSMIRWHLSGALGKSNVSEGNIESSGRPHEEAVMFIIASMSQPTCTMTVRMASSSLARSRRYISTSFCLGSHHGRR